MPTSVVDIHKIVVGTNPYRSIRPEYDIYCGRALPKFMDRNGEFTEHSKWANFWETLEEYRENIELAIEENPTYFNLNELVGRRLACWCITTDKIEPLVCHAQILIILIRERGLE